MSPTGSSTQVRSNPPTCPYCQKQFIQPGNLTRHLKDVHHKRPHPCKQCNKVFKNSSNLRYHVRTVHEQHTYDCEQCGQQFTNRRNLKLHVSSKHQGKVYPCQDCEQVFANPRNLKFHVNAKHLGDVYPCQKCKIIFTTPRDLEAHRNSVHKRGCYACPHCDKSYAHRDSLQSHCTKVHKIQLETQAPQDTASQPMDLASSQQTGPSPAASLDAEISGWLQTDQILTAEAPLDPLITNEEVEVCILEGIQQDSIELPHSASISGQEIDDWIETLSGNTPQLLLPWEDDNPEPPPKRPRLACDPPSDPGYLP